MLICHFSDVHFRKDEPDLGILLQLPKADLYVCTGDMLPDFWRDWPNAAKLQEEWVKEHARQIELPAPLITVRGNHDFASYAPLFKTAVHNFDPAGWVVYGGLTFGVVPGTVMDCGDHWSDEINDLEMEARLSSLPDVDVLVTHQPPIGMLSGPWGSRAIADFVRPSLSLHLFGHVHEEPGVAYSMNAVTNHTVTRVNSARVRTMVEGVDLDGLSWWEWVARGRGE